MKQKTMDHELMTRINKEAQEAEQRKFEHAKAAVARLDSKRKVSFSASPTTDNPVEAAYDFLSEKTLEFKRNSGQPQPGTSEVGAVHVVNNCLRAGCVVVLLISFRPAIIIIHIITRALEIIHNRS